jgi:phosphatidylinositol-3-phosphatase
MEENKGYAATLGSCSADPYFCSLAARYASFTNSHGVSHPSMPNYYAFVSGATQGCTTDGCAPFSPPSLGSQLGAAGVPWTAYMESMPSACDKSNAGGYVVKHDPFVQSTAITSCASHVLPYPGSSGLLAGLGSRTAPDFVWITPNLTDDMHDGSVQQGDAWLIANLKPVLASPWFLDYNSTVIVTMDEGDAGGANQIPTVVLSSHAAGIGGVGTAINHYAVLRAIESAFGLGSLGNAASAPDISNFFG